MSEEERGVLCVRCAHCHMLKTLDQDEHKVLVILPEDELTAKLAKIDASKIKLWKDRKNK